MPRPWIELDSVPTKEGPLSLRQRGDRDFMILVGGRVLMTSMITTSELALAREACSRLAALTAPRVLIGGLGLGFTLRAALDALPRNAKVHVAELNPRVVDWCRGPAAAASQGAALDPRTQIIVGDVTAVIRKIAEDPEAPRYDAILWDLYVGPPAERGGYDPLYGHQSTERTFEALAPGGVFGVWGEGPSPAYERRLGKTGFVTEKIRTAGGGLHHIVFLGTKPAHTARPRPPQKPRPGQTPKPAARAAARPGARGGAPQRGGAPASPRPGVKAGPGNRARPSRKR